MPPRRTTNTNEPKSGYGNGGVHEEWRGSGRWIAELDGVRRRAKSESEAREKLRLLQERRDARLKFSKGGSTVGAWLNTWLAEYCDHLKPKTREGYAEAVRIYIQPYPLARVRLEDLTADDIVEWLAALRRKKITKGKNPDNTKRLADATIAIAFRRLRKALAVAKRHRLISQNPAADVEPPKIASEREPVVLEVEEFKRFKAAWVGRRLYPLYAVVMTLGLRRAEAIGLRWRDIDLEKRTITVRGQLQWLKVEPDKPRRAVWTPSPKTRAGKRTIDMSEELAGVLREWRHTQQEEQSILASKGHGEDYVFTSEEGGPLSPRNLYRGFKAALKRAGLPEDMTFHDLRHCAGSLMLANGEDIEAVREVLGHSSRSITERIYAHALRSRKQQAGTSLGYLLREED